jgi:hypothetical protein
VTLSVFSLREGEYAEAAVGHPGEPLTVSEPYTVVIDVARLLAI